MVVEDLAHIGFAHRRLPRSSVLLADIAVSLLGESASCCNRYKALRYSFLCDVPRQRRSRERNTETRSYLLMTNNGIIPRGDSYLSQMEYYVTCTSMPLSRLTMKSNGCRGASRATARLTKQRTGAVSFRTTRPSTTSISGRRSRPHGYLRRRQPTKPDTPLSRRLASAKVARRASRISAIARLSSKRTCERWRRRGDRDVIELQIEAKRLGGCLVSCTLVSASKCILKTSKAGKRSTSSSYDPRSLP